MFHPSDDRCFNLATDDADMEEKMECLAQEKAKAEAAEAKARSELDATLARAEQNALAVAKLETLVKQLEDEGSAAAATLQAETAKFKQTLDEQETEAKGAKTEFERVAKEKKILALEMDEKIAESGRAMAEAEAIKDALLGELAENKAQNEEYMKAMQEIAKISATLTKTNEMSVNM